MSARRPPPRREFHPFADDVERTLELLATALRGGPFDAAALPDLREDHDALLRGGDPAPDRYALVNVETDRIVNSLNTLSEDVLRWTDRA